jgi:hypothetical protein
VVGVFLVSFEDEDEDDVDPDVGVGPFSLFTLAFLPNEAKKPPEDFPDEEDVIGVRIAEGAPTVADREGPRCRL